MRCLLLVIMLLPCGILQAQWRLSGLESGIMPAVGLHRYTNNELVFERRRNLSTASGTVQWPLAMLHFRNGSRNSWYVGMGLRTDAFTMNKYNFGDALFSILIIPYGGNLYADTLALSQVKFNVSSITLPFAYDYDLTRQASQPLHFHLRLLLIPGMVVSKRVQVERDETLQTANPPSDAALSMLSERYRAGIGSASLWFAPEINITGRQTPGKVGFFFGLQPLAFDLLRTTKSYLSGGSYLKLSMGLQYHWR